MVEIESDWMKSTLIHATAYDSDDGEAESLSFQLEIS